MFNLEQAIANWREQMLAAGIPSPATLDELEGHLREEVGRRAKEGANEQNAFELAIEQIGKARELKDEFSKINQLDLKSIMKKLQITPILSLATVLLATAWLLFSAVMIGKDLFPKDGLISMRVSDGAIVHVQDGVPALLSQGTLYSGGGYHFVLIPALAVPFVLLVVFAIIGCRSLSRNQAGREAFSAASAR